MALFSEIDVDSLLTDYGMKQEGGGVTSALESFVRDFVDGQSVQSGGESMPSDYFMGKLAGAYHADAAPAPAASADVARPALHAYSVVEQAGGAKKIISANKLVKCMGLKPKAAKALAPALNAHVHAYMNKLTSVVKNSKRLVGKTHLKKMATL